MSTLRSHLDASFSRRAAVAGGVGLGLTAGFLRGAVGQTLAQEGTPAAALDAYPEVVITAKEYHLDVPASIPGGLTRLTLKNEGVTGHHAMFLRLNDGSAFADLEAALTRPDLGAVFAVSTSVGGPEVDAGLTATAIVDLLPGRYMAICLIPDATGTPHYMMGMQTPVEVTAGAVGTAPTTDATVEMVDFGFEAMPMTVAPGRHVWEVVNVGEQLHQFLVMRQEPGVTFDQVLAILQPAPAATPGTLTEATPEVAAAAGPEPWKIIGGAAPMSSGQTTWSVLDLEAGEHFAICFIPDPATGAPHFALGMLMPFTVA